MNSAWGSTYILKLLSSSCWMENNFTLHKHIFSNNKDRPIFIVKKSKKLFHILQNASAMYSDANRRTLSQSMAFFSQHPFEFTFGNLHTMLHVTICIERQNKKRKITTQILFLTVHSKLWSAIIFTYIFNGIFFSVLKCMRKNANNLELALTCIKSYHKPCFNQIIRHCVLLYCLFRSRNESTSGSLRRKNVAMFGLCERVGRSLFGWLFLLSLSLSLVRVDCVLQIDVMERSRHSTKSSSTSFVDEINAETLGAVCRPITTHETSKLVDLFSVLQMSRSVS